MVVGTCPPLTLSMQERGGEMGEVIEQAMEIEKRGHGKKDRGERGERCKGEECPR